MQLPNGEIIKHGEQPYDPKKAREYYLRTRKLKGRKKGSAPDPAGGDRGKKLGTVKSSAARKKELAGRIKGLEKKLEDLKILIRAKEKEAREAEAEKVRAAKESLKPDTAAEKSAKAREAKKYRAKNQGTLATKAKAAREKSGGSSSDSPPPPSARSVEDLKMLATRVRGQIAAAKTKLKAL